MCLGGGKKVEAEGGAGEGKALRGTGQAVIAWAMDLETAKEILALVFHARSGEVEKLMQRWPEERCWRGAGG